MQLNHYYAVFDEDGYECCTFRGIWDNREGAEMAAAKLRGEAADEWKMNMGHRPGHQNPRNFTVVPVVLNRIC